MRGDSVTPFYAPAQTLQGLLTAGGHTYTFVGNQSAYPGSVPVFAAGGRTIANLVTDIPNVAASNPRTLVPAIGTNNLSSSMPSIGTDMTNYLNQLSAACTTALYYFVCIPNNLGWFHQASFTLLKNAIINWCAAGSGRYVIDFNDAALDIAGSDGVSGDSHQTHWSSAGADKVAVVMDTAIDTAMAAPPPTPTPTTTMIAYPDRFRRDIATAVANAASGNKIPAGQAVVLSGLPAGSSLQLIRSGVIVFSSTLPALQTVGAKLKLPKNYGAPSVFSVADVDTGTWKLRISNGSAYLEGDLTNAGGAGPFKLSADLDPDDGFSIGDVYLSLPEGLDGEPTGGTTAATLNRVVLGMSGTSDLTPTGLSGGWSQGGAVTMGTKPKGDAIPDWYGYPTVAAIENWYRLQFWWYVNITSGTNRGGNFRVQVRNQIVQIRRTSTGTWQEYGRSSGGDADYYGAQSSGAPEGEAIYRPAVSGGGDEYKLSPNSVHVNIHGYGPSINIQSIVDDIDNVALSCEARLVLDNPAGVDDRSTANLVMISGGDYYPLMSSTNANTGVDYWPGIGSHRPTKITNDWQMFMFTPLSNTREVASSTITNKTVTEAAFRANPPAFSVLV